MAVGASVAVAGLTLALSPLFVELGVSAVVIGVGLCFAGLIYLNFAVPILRVTKFQWSAAFVGGCAPEFLETLEPLRLCAACGYDLRGQDPGGDEIRCPECGQIA